MMTKWHNQVAEVVRRALTIYLEHNRRSAIQENKEIRHEGLRSELKNCDQNLMLERQSQSQGCGRRSRRGRRRNGPNQGELTEIAEENELKMMEMLRFSCSYACISHKRS
jgi:hypothetical protein